MNNKYKNVFFLVLLGCVFVFGEMVFFLKEKSVSELENRSLNSFQHFAVEDFINGDFQDNYEAAISDQFLGSEQIRYYYNQAFSHLPDFGLGDLMCEGRYLELKSKDGKKRGTFGCDGYIVYLPDRLSEEKKKVANENIKKYNKLNKLVDTYYYFVDDASSFDFEKDERVFDYYEFLSSNLDGEKKAKRLEYNSTFDDYVKYYYRTDHHWNKEGSYQGFLDIAKMMDIKKTAEPRGVVTNHEDSFGSHARMTANFDYPEEFSFYKFDIPEHKTMINRVPEEYSNYRNYEIHNYVYDKMTSYYAYVYGGDFGEVVFDFEQPKNGNLLIISNSYSNAVNELIAQYYNKTYVVDLRYYQEQLGESFVLSRYIKDNRIDKVLVIMCPFFLWSEESSMGVDL